MSQLKVNLPPPLAEFVGNYKYYGFDDKNSLVNAALMQLKEAYELQNLQLSADLYAEIYDEEPELQELTEVALMEWPE
jgi:hypothetical protein